MMRHSTLRRVVVAGVLAVLTVVTSAPGSQAATTLPTDGPITTDLRWAYNTRTGGGWFTGSTEYGSSFSFGSNVENSCGGTLWADFDGRGQYEYTTGIKALTGDSAVIDLSSYNTWGAGLPYDSCTDAYHDWTLTGTIKATGQLRIVEVSANRIITERDAIVGATYCMLPWFGRGGACTPLGGPGTLRWVIPLA